MKRRNMNYERLTHQKYDENIDLTQEYGYSHIYKRLHELEDKIEAGNLVEPSTPKQGQNRHVYLDFLDFTQESCYEVTSEVTFQNGDKDEIKTTIVCDDPYDAMKMVKEFLLSKKNWLVTEVYGQRFESGSLLVTKSEIPQSKYMVICDSMKRIFYEDGSYKEIDHYSVIHVVPNDLAVYYGRFDTKEAADERCAELNKIWESVI